jgi:hypothetical protein
MITAWLARYEGESRLRSIAATLRLRSSGHISDLIATCERELDRDGLLRSIVDRCLTREGDSVCAATVADRSDIDNSLFVVDLIEDSIVSDAQPPSIPVALQFSRSRWSWIGRQGADLLPDAHHHVRGQGLELLGGAPANRQPILIQFRACRPSRDALRPR